MHVFHPKFTRKGSSGFSILIARTSKGLKLIEEAIKNKALYAEEANLQDLLIAQGFHLLEGIYYAPLRQKLLQHHITILRELDEIDKIIVLLLTTITMYLLKFKIIRQLLSTHSAEKTLRYVSWFLSRQKYRKRTQVMSLLMTE